MIPLYLEIVLVIWADIVTRYGCLFFFLRRFIYIQAVGYNQTGGEGGRLDNHVFVSV